MCSEGRGRILWYGLRRRRMFIRFAFRYLEALWGVVSVFSIFLAAILHDLLVLISSIFPFRENISLKQRICSHFQMQSLSSSRECGKECAGKPVRHDIRSNSAKPGRKDGKSWRPTLASSESRMLRIILIGLSS
jgi:hypothetical protein